MTPPDPNISLSLHARHKLGVSGRPAVAPDLLSDNAAILQANELAGMARLTFSPPNLPHKRRDIFREFLGNSVDFAQKQKTANRNDTDTARTEIDSRFRQTLSPNGNRPVNFTSQNQKNSSQNVPVSILSKVVEIRKRAPEK